MKQTGFLFEGSSCIGCMACQAACKEAHRLPAGAFYRRVVLSRITDGETEYLQYYSAACTQCARPACAEVCPTDAFFREPDGTLCINASLCVGCGSCASACGLGAIVVRNGTASKCDACRERRAAGRLPACAEACPTNALRFGLQEQFADAREPALPFLPVPAETGPAVRIAGIAKHSGNAAPLLINEKGDSAIK